MYRQGLLSHWYPFDCIGYLKHPDGSIEVFLLKCVNLGKAGLLTKTPKSPDMGSLLQEQLLDVTDAQEKTAELYHDS